VAGKETILQFPVRTRRIGALLPPWTAVPVVLPQAGRQTN